MSIATVVTRGFGTFGTIAFVVRLGFGADAVPPSPPPPPPPPAAVSSGGFDAGPLPGGFGKWFNLAYTTSSSGVRQKPTSDIARILDRLAYAEEDAAAARAAAEKSKPQARAEKRVIEQASAVLAREADSIIDERTALAFVAEQERAWRRLRQETEALARQSFIAAIVSNAVVEYRKAEDARRAWLLMRDDEDMLIFSELMA